MNQKVEPRPSSLVTPISPPISWTRLFEMASPRPVPPNSRRIEPSTWLKRWNSRPCLSRGMPMPVSLTRKRSRRSDEPELFGVSERTVSVTEPCAREFHGIVEKVEEHLPQPGLVSLDELGSFGSSATLT